MNPSSAHISFHPRWYRVRVSTYWWLHQWKYLKFVLRELSSLAVAFFVALTLWQIAALARGPEAYAAFQQRLRSPLWIALNVVSLFFVLFHAITWFNLALRAIVVRMRGRKLPDRAVAAANYLAWLAVSLVLAWLMLRG
jgi:fumarate reductase subunit C